MAQPAADHFPVARRYAEHALHLQGIKIENDRAADPNQYGPEDDVGCVHHRPYPSPGRNLLQRLLALSRKGKGRNNRNNNVCRACCTQALVPRTRSSHGRAAEAFANFGYKSGTRVITLLVPL
jgi:hypothetical protein